MFQQPAPQIWPREVFRQCRVSAAFGGDKGHGLFCDHAGRRLGGGEMAHRPGNL